MYKHGLEWLRYPQRHNNNKGSTSASPLMRKLSISDAARVCLPRGLKASSALFSQTKKSLAVSALVLVLQLLADQLIEKHFSSPIFQTQVPRIRMLKAWRWKRSLLVWISFIVYWISPGFGPSVVQNKTFNAQHPLWKVFVSLQFPHTNSGNGLYVSWLQDYQ